MSTSRAGRRRAIATAIIVASGAGSAGLLASPAAASDATAAVIAAAPAGINDADARNGEVAALVISRTGRPTLVEVTARTAAQAVRKAAAVPGSDEVVVDTPVHATTTNDPLRPRQWHLDRLRVNSLPTGDRSGNVVAVVDSGVRATHEDFAVGQVLCARGRDFTSEQISTNGCVDPKGHGTHVAGIIGAVAGNGRGVGSVAPGTSILPVRVLDSNGSGSSFAVAKGIVYAADQGATVINLSLGGPHPSSALDAAVQYATDRGALVVVSAGNNRKEGNEVNYPAASPGALSVASTDASNVSSGFSYSGPSVDLAAPGGGIVSTYSGTDTTYAIASGTSMAAPVVAAVASLYRAAHPAATPAQVSGELVRTADDLEAPGRDDNTGAGLVDAFEMLAAAATTQPVQPTQPAPAATQPTQPTQPTEPAPPVTQPAPVVPVPVTQPAPVVPVPVAPPVAKSPAPPATKAPARPVVKAPAPRARVVTTRVKKKQPLRVAASGYKPGSTIVVTETYRVGVRQAVRDSRGRTTFRTSFQNKTVTLGKYRVAANGSASIAVLPVQGATTGRLTIWGLDLAGKPIPAVADIRVG